MNYKDIKTYAERCDSHPDHQTGIITNQMIMDRLHDEIEDLREYIETNERKPLTDEEILKMWDDTRNDPIAPSVFCLIACVRHVEQAHGIGSEE